MGLQGLVNYDMDSCLPSVWKYGSSHCNGKLMFSPSKPLR